MAVGNQLTQRTDGQKPVTFSKYLGGEGVKASLMNSLGSEKEVQKFTSSLLSAVSVNPDLQNCDFGSIVACGLLANALNLSLSPQLGYAYAIPFDNKKTGIKTAVFVPGYRGFIQLALRSGQYERINVIEIKEGELKKYNPLTEDIEIEIIEDEEEREKLPTIGYCAYFKLINGYSKTLYWTKSKMELHADRYSPAFSLKATSGRYPKVSFHDYESGKYDKSTEWLYSSFWYKDFDGMAKKTMLRQILSKWGIMSIEMEKLYDEDNKAMNEHEAGAEFAEVNFIETQKKVEDSFFEDESSAPVEEKTEKKPKKTAATKTDKSDMDVVDLLFSE